MSVCQTADIVTQVNTLCEVSFSYFPSAPPTPPMSLNVIFWLTPPPLVGWCHLWTAPNDNIKTSDFQVFNFVPPIRLYKVSYIDHILHYTYIAFQSCEQKCVCYSTDPQEYLRNLAGRMESTLSILCTPLGPEVSVLEFDSEIAR